MRNKNIIPIKFLPEVSYIPESVTKDVYVEAKTSRHASEGWGYGGTLGEVVSIIVFEGTYTKISKGRNRESWRDSHRASCRYTQNMEIIEYHLSKDFAGIFVKEDSYFSTGNYYHNIDICYIRNPRATVNLKFVSGEYINKNGEIKNGVGVVVASPEEADALYIDGKIKFEGEEIVIKKFYKEDADKEIEELKKFLPNFEYRAEYEFISPQQKEELLEHYKNECEKIKSKIIDYKKQGYKVLYKVDDTDVNVDHEKIIILDKNNNIIEDIQLRYYEIQDDNTGGYSRVEKEILLGETTKEIEEYFPAKWRGNELVTYDNSMNFHFYLQREVINILWKYYNEILEIVKD